MARLSMDARARLVLCILVAILGGGLGIGLGKAATGVRRHYERSEGTHRAIYAEVHELRHELERLRFQLELEEQLRQLRADTLVETPPPPDTTAIGHAWPDAQAFLVVP